MLCILRGIINKIFSLKVLSIKFPLKHFLSILGILSIKFSLKVLSIKFPLKYFLILGIVPISKTKSCFQPVGTFKRPEVAFNLLTFSKDQMWLLACRHFQKTRCGS